MLSIRCPADSQNIFIAALSWAILTKLTWSEQAARVIFSDQQKLFCLMRDIFSLAGLPFYWGLQLQLHGPLPILPNSAIIGLSKLSAFLRSSSSWKLFLVRERNIHILLFITSPALKASLQQKIYFSLALPHPGPKGTGADTKITWSSLERERRRHNGLCMRNNWPENFWSSLSEIIVTLTFEMN